MRSLVSDDPAYIYVLIDPRDSEIRYVGWTTDTVARLQRHITEARRATYHRARWIAQLRRYGLKPTLQVVQAVPLSCWAEAEIYWIAHFRARGCRLTNGTNGGQGTPGQVHTAESRVKMSKAHKGRKPGPRGPMTDAHKAKLSEATRRQMADPAMRTAVSAVHAGKTIDPEQRAAVGRAASRRWEQWREGRFPADLAQRYEAGETLAALAAACEVAEPTLKRELLAQGVTLRGRWGHPRKAAA